MKHDAKVKELYKTLYAAGVIQQVTAEKEEYFFQLILQLLKSAQKINPGS